MLLGVYNYTVVLTYLGMVISLFGVTLAAQGHILAAAVCLMCSGVCDMFDGKVASTKVRTAKEKRFGVQIDSLSDLICFGVLPAMIALGICRRCLYIIYIIGGLYVLCALIRLAWFNVDEEERQDATDESRQVYQGLPVTTSALIVPAVLGVGMKLELPLQWIMPAVLAAMACAFLIPFRLKKPGNGGKLAMLLAGGVELAVLLSEAVL